MIVFNSYKVNKKILGKIIFFMALMKNFKKTNFVIFFLIMGMPTNIHAPSTNLIGRKIKK